jgi:hypothetical protein
VARLSGVAITKQRRNGEAPDVIAVDSSEPAVIGEPGTGAVQDR